MVSHRPLPPPRSLRKNATRLVAAGQQRATPRRRGGWRCCCASASLDRRPNPGGAGEYQVNVRGGCLKIAWRRQPGFDLSWSAGAGRLLRALAEATGVKLGLVDALAGTESAGLFLNGSNVLATLTTVIGNHDKGGGDVPTIALMENQRSFVHSGRRHFKDLARFSFLGCGHQVGLHCAFWLNLQSAVGTLRRMAAMIGCCWYCTNSYYPRHLYLSGRGSKFNR